MRKVLYIFGLLTDGDIEWMARTGARRWVKDGEVLIHEGRPVDSLVFLLEGELSVSVAGIGEIARLGVGEIVGEMSYVDSAPPFATVTARGKSLALFVGKEALSQKLATDVAFGCRFYRALAMFLADRLRDTVRRLGYGEKKALADDGILKDELDMAILDNVSMAGDRFHRMLKMLSGAR
ncbi:MAG: cyclic nucleotide-binding domain-containing protein [Alphaproteobacteria bacterium]